MPELMSAAEIAEALGVARQRVHQLRSITSRFRRHWQSYVPPQCGTPRGTEIQRGMGAQAGLLRNDDGTIVLSSPAYTPDSCR